MALQDLMALSEAKNVNVEITVKETGIDQAAILGKINTDLKVKRVVAEKDSESKKIKVTQNPVKSVEERFSAWRKQNPEIK